MQPLHNATAAERRGDTETKMAFPRGLWGQRASGKTVLMVIPPRTAAAVSPWPMHLPWAEHSQAVLEGLKVARSGISHLGLNPVSGTSAHLLYDLGEPTSLLSLDFPRNTTIIPIPTSSGCCEN